MKTLKINLKLNNNFEINETKGIGFAVEVVKNPNIAEHENIAKQNIKVLAEDRLAMYRRKKGDFPRGLSSAMNEAVEMIKALGKRA